MLDIKITRTTCPKEKPQDETKLGFGKKFTDHMFVMDYTEGEGWHDARIVPYAPFPLDPATVVFHYAQEIFEGMKAYRTADDTIQLFRPDCNAKRMQDSADRLCIPKIPVEDYIQAVEALVDVDRDWVPHADGASLYIRPFVFANDVGLGVHASKHYIFCIICAPSGAYYAEGINPVRIYVEDEYIRAAPGLTGFTKCGGNYAASIKAGELAEEQGYAQVLWLDGVEKKYVEEVGSMNIMFKIDGKVYTAATPAEAAEIVKTIYASGYPDRMVLQKMVPGGDDHMRVLTAFSDENGKVRAMCLGHTMVEEHTPHGLGNHAAIVSEDTTSLPLVENIRKMLEACRYTGFSNFDIKYSGIPGDYRVFEINLRQGRSNYYVTATGMNIARLVVEKWNDGGTDCVLNKNEVFWHHVPAQVAFTYTEDKDLVARAKALKAQLIRMADGRQVNLVLTTGGTGFSPRDITPEATCAVADRNAPGIAEAMRYHSLSITPRGMLSRGVSVLRGKTLIVNLPGSPKAVQENLEYILPSLEHGVRIAAGLDGECARK